MNQMQNLEDTLFDEKKGKRRQYNTRRRPNYITGRSQPEQTEAKSQKNGKMIHERTNRVNLQTNS